MNPRLTVKLEIDGQITSVTRSINAHPMDLTDGPLLEDVVRVATNQIKAALRVHYGMPERAANRAQVNPLGEGVYGGINMPVNAEAAQDMARIAEGLLQTQEERHREMVRDIMGLTGVAENDQPNGPEQAHVTLNDMAPVMPPTPPSEPGGARTPF